VSGALAVPMNEKQLLPEKRLACANARNTYSTPHWSWQSGLVKWPVPSSARAPETPVSSKSRSPMWTMRCSLAPSSQRDVVLPENDGWPENDILHRRGSSDENHAPPLASQSESDIHCSVKPAGA